MALARAALLAAGLAGCAGGSIKDAAGVPLGDAEYQAAERSLLPQPDGGAGKVALAAPRARTLGNGRYQESGEVRLDGKVVGGYLAERIPRSTATTGYKATLRWAAEQILPTANAEVEWGEISAEPVEGFLRSARGVVTLTGDGGSRECAVVAGWNGLGNLTMTAADISATAATYVAVCGAPGDGDTLMGRAVEAVGRNPI